MKKRKKRLRQFNYKMDPTPPKLDDRALAIGRLQGVSTSITTLHVHEIVNDFEGALAALYELEALAVNELEKLNHEKGFSLNGNTHSVSP